MDRWARSNWRPIYASRSLYSLSPFVQLYRHAYQLLIRIFALYHRKSTVQYDYEPLEDGKICLIYLQPGAKDELLKALIMPISLECYDLITEEGTVPITRSLCFALKRFRLRGAIRVLWADAVCINQEDNLEKGKQVGVMSDIYSLAMRTQVYLGEAADNSAKDIDPIELCLFGLLPEGDPVWKALEIFWGRPLFRRVWVIQEFVRSLDVVMVCGTWQGDWMIFCSATQKCRPFLYTFPTCFNVFESMAMDGGISAMALNADIRSRFIGITLQSAAPDDKLGCIGSAERVDMLQNLSYPFLPPDPGRWPATMSPMHQRRLNDRRKLSPLFRIGGRFPLLKLLSCCERSDSTRTRDHLFDCAEDELFRPDYTAPFEEVVRRCRDESQTYRFPSWIPDLTTKYVGLAVDAVRESPGSSNLYRASEDSLLVTGGIVDTVMWTGATPTSTSLDINILESFSRDHGIAWPLCLIREAHTAITFLPFYPTGEPLEEVLRRTLIANKTHKGLKAPDDFGDQFSGFHQRKDGFLESLETLSARTWLMRSIGEQYYESLMEIFPQYKLVITKNLYFGVVPLLTEASDRVCILNGGAVPFVLMERKKPKTGYRLTGECYIHGIMNGEVFQKKGWREEEISIY